MLFLADFDKQVINLACHFSCPFLDMEEMADVCFVCNLIQVVRHSGQRAQQGQHIMGNRFPDIAVDRQFIDDGRERLPRALAPINQLSIVGLVEIDLDGI